MLKKIGDRILARWQRKQQEAVVLDRPARELIRRRHTDPAKRQARKRQSAMRTRRSRLSGNHRRHSR